MKIVYILIFAFTVSYPLSELTKLHPFHLSLEQKIAQLIIIPAVCDIDSNKQFIQNTTYTVDTAYVQTLVTKYPIGGVIFLGRSNPQSQMEYTQSLQNLSNIPLLIAQDLEWGLAMRHNGVLKFPHALTLGAIEDTELIYQLGLEIARQCRILGVHINFAPVCDINTNPANPVIGMRSFGQDKKRVAQAAKAYAQGLADGGIIACAKHFPGHGDTATDSHYSLPRVEHTIERLHTIELYPFKKIIKSGIPMVMTAHIIVSALEPRAVPATLSRVAVTDLLKKELGFTGITITDGLGMAAIAQFEPDPGTIAVKALQAGIDVLLCPLDVEKTIEAVKQAVHQGVISEDEIDKRVAKILDLKKRIFIQQDAIPHLKNVQHLETEHTRLLKKELYAHAITIAQDTEQLIPFNHNIPESALYIQIGRSEKTAFAAYCAQNKIDQVLYYSNDDNVKKHPQDLSKIKNARMSIFALFGTTNVTDQWNNCFNVMHTLLEQGQQVIVVLFGNPYCLPKLDPRITVLIAYESDIDAQKAAGEVLFGTQKVLGLLPLNVENS